MNGPLLDSTIRFLVLASRFSILGAVTGATVWLVKGNLSNLAVLALYVGFCIWTAVVFHIIATHPNGVPRESKWPGVLYMEASVRKHFVSNGETHRLKRNITALAISSAVSGFGLFYQNGAHFLLCSAISAVILIAFGRVRE